MQRREEMVDDIDDHLKTLTDRVEHEREQSKEN